MFYPLRNWQPHATNPNYIQCTDYVSYVCLVRIHPMPKGYLWQAHKHYGYAASIQEAQAEAEEIMLIQLMH